MMAPASPRSRRTSENAGPALEVYAPVPNNSSSSPSFWCEGSAKSDGSVSTGTPSSTVIGANVRPDLGRDGGDGSDATPEDTDTRENTGTKPRGVSGAAASGTA